MEDPILGTTIAGRYRVESRLGEGGMGSVYRVEHTAMRKKLALKLLHREMTRQPEMVARFEREALAAAHIEHPNVAGRPTSASSTTASASSCSSTSRG
ncbi:MAG: hypothetical protein IPJ34_01990 [Myxococcales bacterium]|nr:hypothetical protein [Myxococcales bacterium]